QRYVNAVRPEISTPGLQAIGFSARVPRTEHDPFERQVQARGWPFAIWPTGERDEFHTVVYVYPFDSDNLRAFGYDMFTEPVRREAMMRARDQNAAAMSGHLRLVQEQSQDSAQPGFLLYLPVYQPAQPTGSIAERRAALRGFVFGAFRARDLMDSIFDEQHWDTDFEIYDSAYASSAGLLYRSVPDDAPVEEWTSADSLSRRASFEIAGRRWLLLARPSTRFLSFADRYQSWLI